MTNFSPIQYVYNVKSPFVVEKNDINQKKNFLCSLQDIHELMNLSCQLPTLVNKVNFHLKSFFMSFGGICLMIMNEKLPRINKKETSHLLG